MTAAWDTEAPLLQLQTIGNAIPDLTAVFLGVPKTLPATVCAFISLGGQKTYEKAVNGLLQRDLNYRFTVGYRTDGAPADAEATVARVVDVLVSALYADRTVGNTLERMSVDATAADQPRYTQIGGQEFRQFPVLVMGVQRKTFPN